MFSSFCSLLHSSPGVAVFSEFVFLHVVGIFVVRSCSVSSTTRQFQVEFLLGRLSDAPFVLILTLGVVACLFARPCFVCFAVCLLVCFYVCLFFTHFSI